jgi:prepilin-type N-terminal cleavage/methylation domain-containing protein
MNMKKGFTLIELLVVISIISLLSSVVLASVATARMKARDAKRLLDMKQVMLALDLYYDANGRYPDSDDVNGADGCGGWDIGNQTKSLFTNNVLSSYISVMPRDLSATGCNGIKYYRYDVSYGCTVPFYILGITDMETKTGTYPGSPGFSCPTRNWQGEFEWVTGKSE